MEKELNRSQIAALEAYPVHKGASKEWIKHCLSAGDCACFIKGYEQAEKDLALTVEDVLLLMHIWTELPDLQFKTLEAIAEETLKRFNEQRNGL